jgi:hypothetical protein
LWRYQWICFDYRIHRRGTPNANAPIAQFPFTQIRIHAVVAVLTDDEREWDFAALQTFVTRVRFIAHREIPPEMALIKIRAALRDLDERTGEPGGGPT